MGDRVSDGIDEDNGDLVLGSENEGIGGYACAFGYEDGGDVAQGEGFGGIESGFDEEQAVF